MILVLEYFRACEFELGSDRLIIIVVEAKPLAADLDAHDDSQPEVVSLIKYSPCIIGAPGSERRATM